LSLVLTRLTIHMLILTTLSVMESNVRVAISGICPLP
jgi:hypothetical protein